MLMKPPPMIKENGIEGEAFGESSSTSDPVGSGADVVAVGAGVVRLTEAAPASETI